MYGDQRDAIIYLAERVEAELQRKPQRCADTARIARQIKALGAFEPYNRLDDYARTMVADACHDTPATRAACYSYAVEQARKYDVDAVRFACLGGICAALIQALETRLPVEGLKTLSRQRPKKR